MLKIPFYNPNLSYEENYQKGPYGDFTDQTKIKRSSEASHNFLGHKVHLPFGIPAGPLINAKFVQAAFEKGFDICIYKTVRTEKYPCHPWPNILAVHEKKLEFDRLEPVVANNNYKSPLSITNSFGVPSATPKIWQEDMAKAVKTAGDGQVLVGSFQGTTGGKNKDSYIKDFVKAAQLVKETGAPILEANLSCPNEGTANLLYLDTEKTLSIVQAIRKAIGSTPLILKTAYFKDQDQLEDFIAKVGPLVDGLATINTITATVVDKDGKQALPGEGRQRSGICGECINWAGLEMTERLKKIRNDLKLEFQIIGVGGVTSQKDFLNYRKVGADVVMSATGAMWNPSLSAEIQAAKLV